jgi:hypothetical protein
MVAVDPDWRAKASSPGSEELAVDLPNCGMENPLGLIRHDPTSDDVPLTKTPGVK